MDKTPVKEEDVIIGYTISSIAFDTEDALSEVKLEEPFLENAASINDSAHSSVVKCDSNADEYVKNEVYRKVPGQSVNVSNGVFREKPSRARIDFLLSFGKKNKESTLYHNSKTTLSRGPIVTSVIKRNSKNSKQLNVNFANQPSGFEISKSTSSYTIKLPSAKSNSIRSKSHLLHQSIYNLGKLIKLKHPIVRLKRLTVEQVEKHKISLISTNSDVKKETEWPFHCHSADIKPSQSGSLAVSPKCIPEIDSAKRSNINNEIFIPLKLPLKHSRTKDPLKVLSEKMVDSFFEEEEEEQEIQGDPLQYCKVEAVDITKLEDSKNALPLFFNNGETGVQYKSEVNQNEDKQLRSGKDFVQKQKCRKNIETYGALDFVCSYCPSQFSQKSYLNIHIRAMHLRIRPYICKYCNKDFPKNASLKKHINGVHLKLKPYSCNISDCTRVFATHSRLVDHIDSFHLKLRPFKCPHCPKYFISEPNLKIHVAAVHEKLKNFVCDCGSRFSMKGDLNKHISAVHKKERPYMCPYCSQAFSSNKSLVRHNETVHLKLKPFVCSSCDRRFGSKGVMLKHIKIVHEKLRPHKCTMCDAKFGGKGNLDLHMNRDHFNIKPFACKWCSKTFLGKTYLKSHEEAIHLKLKPFTCSHCGKCFAHKKKMGIHIKNVHMKRGSVFLAVKQLKEQCI